MAHSYGGWKFQGTDPDRFGVWWGLLSWCLCGVFCSPLTGQKRPGRFRSLLKDTDEMPESVSLRTRSPKDLSTKTIHWVLAFNVWFLEWQAVQTIEFCFSFQKSSCLFSHSSNWAWRGGRYHLCCPRFWKVLVFVSHQIWNRCPEPLWLTSDDLPNSSSHFCF